MRTVDIVLGNGFGDEGKGHVVDWLADPAKDSIVVRYCGGAQAGHTVATSNGLRHVFHHFGSGTLRGAPTFLTRYFACDPVVFVRELAELKPKVSPMPRVHADPRCPVVTPYDVLLNQLTETHRGKARHGSCGHGFGETMRRHEERPERLCVADLLLPFAFLQGKLLAIEAQFYQELLRRGISCSEEDLRRDIEKFIPMFFGVAKVFTETVRVEVFNPMKWSHGVFEGSQGLLLDREIGTFPHVTRAKTGLANIPKIMDMNNVDRSTVWLVSRCYMTRHGAGPLREEYVMPFVNNEGETNVLNPWQGQFRYGAYDEEILNWAWERARAEVTFPYRWRRVTTCLDQINGKVPVIGTTDKDASYFEGLSDVVAAGPTRNDFNRAAF